ncbi:hypothetical protein [Prevotella veroralis]|uniref:Uncharacterized protein n=1 Tax=Prevotella veroralis F0319 TaxID=649761 RepID=C9MPG4_9BACT|nr:hypothetical protein [Prevotella veroralis]EEX18561.1 hypothetical protein HMPREF0973_01505 [Prevotella veroralis F0319]QUB41999.1 hypothetical protein J5A55_08875 [Prevotella veroralis]
MDPSKKVDDYLKSLFRSMKMVNKCYIHDNYHDSGEDFTYVERTFAYEFYYQWRTDLLNIDKNVRIDAEIPKQFLDKCKIKNEGECIYNNVYPDMVLHKGQGDCDENYIVCEFKREHNLSGELICNDLKKLQLYIDSTSETKQSKDWKPFSRGVFILIFNNINNDPIEKILKDRLTSIEEEINTHIRNKEKIICCIYDGDKSYCAYLNKLIK